MLDFGGYQKLTLLDYPGKIAMTVFLGNCNFRCPFCHNSELFSPTETYAEDEIFEMIKSRAGKIEGVAITGGEPTLHEGLLPFMQRVKNLGLNVKLDTNGYRPEILANVLSEGLADYVAMDIKSSREGYGLVSGVPDIDITKIEKSADMLLSGSVPFEFRTTVVPELHSEEDFESIANWLAGDESYFLQGYKDSDMVYDRRFSQPTAELMESIRQIVLPKIPNTQIRGVE